MNQNLEEEKIRQLFLELREQDGNKTPSFAAVLNAAQATSSKSVFTWLGWRVAAAMALLIIISGAAFFLFGQSLTTQRGTISAKAETFHFDTPDWRPKSKPDRTIPTPLVAHNPPVEKRERRVVYHRRIKQAPQPSDALISNWQSPTDFLLRTPDTEWLRSLPQIGEILLEIKTLPPDGKLER